METIDQDVAIDTSQRLKQENPPARAKLDHAWKRALHLYLKDFVALCWPVAYEEIDWSRPYDILDQELQEIVRDAREGDHRADVLVKAWRRAGDVLYLLIHCEIQAQKDKNFQQRMYVYNYRIFDRHQHPVASLGILIDKNAAWRPSEYRATSLESTVTFTFPIIKLLDYEPQRAWLETSDNPFALILLAQLDANKTQPNQSARLLSKFALTKRLLKSGRSSEETRSLLLFFDWILRLSRPLELDYLQQVKEEEATMHVDYIHSAQRLGIEQGIEQGITQGMERVALNMFSLGIPRNDIALMTGLSQESLQQLMVDKKL